MAKINLMGVFQGGTLSTIYAAIHPQKVRNLVTLATPVDFSFTREPDLREDSRRQPNWMEEAEKIVCPSFEPLKSWDKSEHESAVFPLIEGGRRVFYFHALEPLLTGGKNHVGMCFRQFLQDLFLENRLVKGTLQVGPFTVNLRHIQMPVLNVCAEGDYLVPLISGKALNELAGSTDKTLLNITQEKLKRLAGPQYFLHLLPEIGSWLKKRD
jgi:polyhydroxyalkanoate synthase subunit PhaC